MPLEAKYELEIGRWQKRLEQLQQENVQLKTKVADIIKDDIDMNILERMEYFLTSFINKDAVLALLRYDLAEQLKATRKNSDAASTSLIEKKQLKLSQDMTKMEEEFDRLKLDFNTYIESFEAAS